LKDQTGSMITLHVHSEKRPVLSAGRFTMMMMPFICSCRMRGFFSSFWDRVWAEWDG
jgi:hypothetical protein